MRWLALLAALFFASPAPAAELTSQGAGLSYMAGSFTPSSLGGKLIAWWDANTGVTESGGAVSAWTDSVASVVVAQGVAGNQPVYSATSFANSKPGITFDGVDDYLTLASPTFCGGATDCEMWGLVQQTALAADTTDRRAASLGGASSRYRELLRRVSAGVNRFQALVGNGSSPITITNSAVDFSGYAVVRLYNSGTTMGISVNGGAVTTTTVTPNTASTTFRIGAFSGAVANYWQGQIAAIIVTQPLTTGEAQQLANYLYRRAF